MCFLTKFLRIFESLVFKIPFIRKGCGSQNPPLTQSLSHISVYFKFNPAKEIVPQGLDSARNAFTFWEIKLRFSNRCPVFQQRLGYSGSMLITHLAALDEYCWKTLCCFTIVQTLRTEWQKNVKCWHTHTALSSKCFSPTQVQFCSGPFQPFSVHGQSPPPCCCIFKLLHQYFPLIQVLSEKNVWVNEIIQQAGRQFFWMRFHTTGGDL